MRLVTEPDFGRRVSRTIEALRRCATGDAWRITMGALIAGFAAEHGKLKAEMLAKHAELEARLTGGDEALKAQIEADKAARAQTLHTARRWWLWFIGGVTVLPGVILGWRQVILIALEHWGRP